MTETVTMPKLGFDMAEGTLIRWVQAEGDEVKKGAVLAEIETDKATVEVESNFDGILQQHLVKEGDIVPVGTPIAVIGAPGEEVEVEKPPVEKGAQKPEQANATQITTEQAPADAAAKVSAEELLSITSALEEPGLPGGLRASPIARRIATERGVDLRTVKGSGPLGRITRKDVETAAEKGIAQPASKAPTAPTRPVEKAALLTPFSAQMGPPQEDRRLGINRLRAAIGRRMVEAKQQAPHFYVTHEYDMGPVMALRKTVNELLDENGKISVNDFVIKATALALSQFPNLNATLEGNEIVQRGMVNIGVAVAVESGLLTVVCKDSDRKPLRQIAAEVKSMAGRAREGRVRTEDIEGSTFSISNLGMYDVDEFIAIINPPEAAILAVGSARAAPVVKNGEVVPGLRMKATISVDHRVSDGAEAARFMQTLALYLEEPMRLLI